MRDTALQTARPAHPARHSRRDGAATTQRWAVGVLAVSTVLLLGYAALLVVAGWLVASGWNVVTTGRSVSVDVLAIGSDLAPALLVGWCTGLAASAVLARGEALGARTAGMVAGTVGTAAGAALLALTGLL
jgi:hypothetical protein